jgi:hypothetical protein
MPAAQKAVILQLNKCRTVKTCRKLKALIVPRWELRLGTAKTGSSPTVRQKQGHNQNGTS